MNRALVALLALAASACSFAPAYQRPEVAIPPEHRFAPPGETTPIADLGWWQVFRDPVLQGLIKEALESNQDLALAVARVQEARAFLGVARADFYPQVNGTANATYGQQYSKNYLPGSRETGNYALAAGLSWELDLWGRVRNASAAASADLLAAEDTRHAVVLSLVSGVAQAYLELRELDLELQIAQTNTGLRQGTLSLFEARAKGGIASDLEVNQARSDLAVTTAAIPSTQLAIAQKEHQLCVLLGRPPGPIARGAALVDTPVPPTLPAGVPAQLLTRRPDLLASEQGVMAAGSRVGVAVANRLPVISLTGLIGLNSTQTSNLFSADSLVWNAGGGLLAPIFQGGRLKSQEEAARAQLEQAVAVYKRAVQVALGEVADAAAGTRWLRDVRAARTEQVKATTAATKLALARYEGGVSSYLEVLDAQRQQFDSELSLAQSQRDELTSVVQLYRALGGGWQEPPAEPAPTAAPPPPAH
ncbi:MAG TPA: efflux transporter outer membrane subunit [Anaeromyxobacter sp.]|nr:efflux transporter outer membrane subunit [Anaeromyxobacter sp.]